MSKKCSDRKKLEMKILSTPKLWWADYAKFELEGHFQGQKGQQHKITQILVHFSTFLVGNV